MSTRQQILREIDAFLREFGVSGTAFGERAINDRTLVGTLRGGRELKSVTIDKLRAYMARERKKAARRASRPNEALVGA